MRPSSSHHLIRWRRCKQVAMHIGSWAVVAACLGFAVVLPSDQVQAIAAVISTVATVVATIAVVRQYRKTQTRDKSPD